MGLFDNENPDDEVSDLVETARSDTVTRDRLTDPKGGGMLENNLGHAPIVDFLADDEQPHFILHNTSKGAKIHHADDERTIKPKGKRRAFAVLTDRRVVFLVGADEVKEFELAYDDIEALTTRTGRLKHRLLIRDDAALVDFPIFSNDLDDDEMERFRSFLDEQSGGASAEWTDESTEVSRLSATEETVVRGDAERDDELVTMAKNMNGMTIKVYPDRVEIARKEGTVMQGVEKEILYDSLHGVEFSKAKTIGGPGFVYLNQAGGESCDNPMEKRSSRNSVTFQKKRNEDFREVKDVIQERLRERQSSSETSSNESKSDPAIETLREQYATGEISKEEYEERLAVLEDT